MNKQVLVPVALGALTLLIAGCGTSTHNGGVQAKTGTQATASAYKVKISESLPSSPKPVAVDWNGIWSAKKSDWTSLSVSMGGGASVPIIPSNSKYVVAEEPVKVNGKTVEKKIKVVNETLVAAGYLSSIVKSSVDNTKLPTNLIPMVPLSIQTGASFQKGQTVTHETHIIMDNAELSATVKIKSASKGNASTWAINVVTKPKALPENGTKKTFVLPSLIWSVNGSETPVS